MTALGDEELVVQALLGEGLVQGLGAFEEEVGIAAGEEIELHASLLEGRDLLRGGGTGGGKRADVVEHLWIQVGGRDGVAAAHGQAGDGAGRGLRDGAEVLLDERDDLLAEAHHIAVHELVALGFGHLGEGLAVETHLHLLLGNAEGAGGRLVGVAVRHDDDHRLGQALLDEVVQDLGGTAHGRPGFLVTTGAMQEVKDRILLLGVVLVAVRGVDRQAAVHAEDGAVVPGMAHGAVLVGLTVVLGALAGDDEHREVTGAVTLDIDVLGIVDRDTVHDEVVGVDFRLRERDLHFPDVAGTAEHVDGAAPGVGLCRKTIQRLNAML